MGTLDLSAGIAPERVRPLRREEYDRLVAMGLFAGERLELLHGNLVEMMPQDPRHAAVTQRIDRALTIALGENAIVRAQMPLALTADSEPEPDVAVVPPGDYDEEHPARAYLVVEVAGASLAKDRRVKGPLYAQAGIPEYWLVSLADRQIEVHADLAGGTYRRVTPYRPGESIRLNAFPDVSIAVSDVLG